MSASDLAAHRVAIDPTLPQPAWRRVAALAEANLVDHRSRARSCWQTARNLRRYVRDHAWHMIADDITATLEHAQDLRKAAAAHVRAARTNQ